MDKILFICEGAETEKRFCNLIIDKYFIEKKKPKEFVAFKTNIYGLYHELASDEGLDVVELIKEKAKINKDNITYNKLNNGGFSQVYLIFDFDFQAPQYDDGKIRKMVQFFNNETEQGKLYINYPMLESFKHFKSLPDNDFNNYVVTKNECLTYKKIVGNLSIIKHFSDISEDVLKIIVKQNLDKLAILLNQKNLNYSIYLNEFNQEKILKLQLKTLNDKGFIYVLNTSLFWGIDYFGEVKFNEYISLSLMTI